MTETLRLAGLAGASALESSAVVVDLVAACEAAGLSALDLDPQRLALTSGHDERGCCFVHGGLSHSQAA
jgi:hypothetical protein